MYEFIAENMLNISLFGLVYCYYTIWKKDRIIRNLTLTLSLTQITNSTLIQEIIRKLDKQNDVNDEVN